MTKEYEKNVLSGGTYKKWIKPEVYLAVWLILTELIFANVNDSEKNYTDDTHTTNTWWCNNQFNNARYGY